MTTFTYLKNNLPSTCPSLTSLILNILNCYYKTRLLWFDIINNILKNSSVSLFLYLQTNKISFKTHLSMVNSAYNWRDSFPNQKMVLTGLCHKVSFVTRQAVTPYKRVFLSAFLTPPLKLRIWPEDLKAVHVTLYSTKTYLWQFDTSAFGRDHFG